MDKSKQKKIIITVCVILAAVLVIGLAVYNRVSETGAILRSQTAASTENFEVTGTMMRYFLGEQYMGMSSYASYLGIDTTKSLKSQECSFTGVEGATWFDYFVGSTKTYVTEILANCEAAHKTGISLTEDDHAKIDENLAALEEAAAAYGYSLDQYLSLAYGAGVNAKDARACLELLNLAYKHQENFYDGLSYTDEELDAYYNANKSKFEGVDYLSFTVSANDLVEKDEDGNPVGSSDKAASLAMDEAEKLAAAKSRSSFESLIRKYLTNYTNTEEDAINDKIEAAYKRHAVAADISNISEWAFEASVGDTHIEGKEGDTSLTVYYLLKTGYRDDTVTRNVRHVLFSTDTYEDDTKVNEIYAEWEAAGFTEDKISELAGLYSEDTGSKENGGLYENVAIGDTVNEFNAWLYDSDRKTGDHGIVESTYGWHIMYYIGEGDKSAWKMNAINVMEQEDYSELLEDYSANVTYNDKTINKIDM